MSARFELRQRVWVPTFKREVRRSRGSSYWHTEPGPLVHPPGRYRTVAEFPTADEAAAEQAVRERAARAGTNPFRYGGSLAFQSVWPSSEFQAQLAAVGLAPPIGGESMARLRWWDSNSASWTEEQRGAVWTACDKVRFFDVIEFDPARRAFVIVEATWNWDDDSFNADPEGGVVRIAFRSRENAEAYCVMLEEDARKTGVSGSLAIPIFSADGLSVIGTLGIGKVESYNFSKEEKERLTAIGRSFAGMLVS